MDYYGNNDFRYYQKTNDHLAHHGILGMHWGIRRFQPYSVHPRKGGEGGKEVGEAKKAPLRTRIRAKRDAKEFARAKMYYGEGAGNRRKLIKAKVNEYSKDPRYKEEFEKALAKQDMAKHASKAIHERHRNTAVKETVKTTRGLINLSTGNLVKASASAVAIYKVAKITGADKRAASFVRRAVKHVSNNVNTQRVRAWMRRRGF